MIFKPLNQIQTPLFEPQINIYYLECVYTKEVNTGFRLHKSGL